MPIRIMYLDDEPALCENFSDAFHSQEVNVTTFCDPEQFTEAVKKNPPDLVFVDYRLPTTNGDKVAQALDPGIPKILISGDLDISTTYAFVKVIQKPYEDEEIFKILENYRERCKA